MDPSKRPCNRDLNSDEHNHSPEEEAEIREAALDETIAETFPASDPPSTIPNPDLDKALYDPDTQEK